MTKQYLDSPSVDELDIQGDILIGLQKRAEIFSFFEITDVLTFRSEIKTLVNLFTSLRTTRLYETNVTGPSKSPLGEPLDKMNIAFTHAGLKKLGFDTTGLDPAFLKGQRARAETLGDDLANWQSAYDADVAIDGVILSASFRVSGPDDALDAALGNAAATIAALSGGASLLHQEIGKVRSGTGAEGVDQAGHEHFGFADGVSQPGIDGLSSPLSKDKTGADKGFPGQDLVAPGEFVFGNYANEHGKQAIPPQPWMTNGSYMVFRRLNQDVEAFQQYVGTAWNGFASGPDQFAARLVGRWPDGSPLVRNPAFPNAGETGDLPFANNNFDFGPVDATKVATDPDQSRCPFAAHIRRMYMRSDAANDGSEKHRIIRAGIAFGDDEARDKGLLFVCYQTSIEHQFEFVQKLASNPKSQTVLPFAKGMNAPAASGLDLILGSSAGVRDAIWASGTTKPAAPFVVATGGAYLFMPSLTLLAGL
jgi:Dyp-type peroxidase family